MKKVFKKYAESLKTFEEWAQAHGIEIKKTKQKTPKIFLLKWGSTVAVLILLTLSILPICFYNIGSKPFVPDTTVAPAENEPSIEEPEKDSPIYSTELKNIAFSYLTIEELYQIDGLLLFDSEQILNCKNIYKDLPTDNENLILGYTLENCFVVTRDGSNGFFINWKIRFYKNYEFDTHEVYADLKEDFFANEINFFYEINETENANAYVRFEYNNAEYFLNVKGFPGVTKITDETLKILLNDLFIQ